VPDRTAPPCRKVRHPPHAAPERQADDRALAGAWVIAEPPRVDFRTHFLAVHAWARFAHVARFVTFAVFALIDRSGPASKRPAGARDR